MPVFSYCQLPDYLEDHYSLFWMFVLVVVFYLLPLLEGSAVVVVVAAPERSSSVDSIGEKEGKKKK